MSICVYICICIDVYISICVCIGMHDFISVMRNNNFCVDFVELDENDKQNKYLHLLGNYHLGI